MVFQGLQTSKFSLQFKSRFGKVHRLGHITDPVPLIEKKRGLYPGGRFPPSFIHQVIIIILVGHSV